jgi:predicted anti-sigma-YlaC factor YlaD
MSELDPELLGRLLGPEGPELTCEACFEALDVYVERELDGRDAEAAAPGMAAHLQGCPACREDHDSLLALLTRDRRRGAGGCGP